MGFLLRYLATALVGTLLIYYGLPRLKPLLPELFPVMDMTGPRDTPPPGGALQETEHDVPPPLFVRAEPVALPVATATGQPAEDAVSATGTEPPVDAATNGTPAAQPVAPASTAAPSSPPEPVVITQLGYTPSTQRIRASGTDITHWGVALQHAPFFEKDGKRRAEVLPGGTLVEQIAVTTSSKGEMALCRIWRGSGWAGPFLIATTDLIRFPGGRDKVDADELDVLLRYAVLNARAEARKKELTRLGVEANPHAAPLRRLKEKYDAAGAEAERLTRQRDAAGSAERIRLGDELRRVKEREPRMRRELESLTRQYEAWKSSHDASAAASAQDAQLQAIQAQMLALRPRLGNFGM
jgi:hypothetical protein